MTGSIARIRLVLATDSRIATRAGGGPGVTLAVLVALAVLTCAVAVGLAAWASGVVDEVPAAGRGVVLVAFTLLGAAAVAGPFVSAGGGRVDALVRWSGVPLGGREILAARSIRELVSTPVAPALGIAVALCVGSGVAVSGAVLAVLLVLGLVPLAHIVRAGLPGRLRRASGTVVVVAIGLVSAVLSTRAAGDDPGAALAALGADPGPLWWLPSTWAAVAASGSLPGTLLGLVALLALVAVVVPASALAAPATARSVRAVATRGSAARAPARPADDSRRASPRRALLATDLRLLFRDPALRRAALRQIAPALVPVALVLAATTPSRASLAVHVLAVASASVGLDLLDLGGGGAWLLRSAARARDLVFARAIACAAWAVPALALSGGLLVAATGGGTADVLAGGFEGAASALAACGAAVLVGVAGAAPRANSDDEVPAARRGVSGLALGLASTLVAALAVAPVALTRVALRRVAVPRVAVPRVALGGAGGAAVALVVGLVVGAAGVAVAAALLRRRRGAVYSRLTGSE